MQITQIALSFMLALPRIGSAMPVPDASEATLESRVIPPFYKGEATRHQLAGTLGAFMSLTGAFTGFTGFMVREDTHQRQRKQDLERISQQQRLLRYLPRIRSRPEPSRTSLVKRWWGGPTSAKYMWTLEDYLKPAAGVISMVAGTGWLATSIRDNVAVRKKPLKSVHKLAASSSSAGSKIRRNPQELPDDLYRKHL